MKFVWYIYTQKKLYHKFEMIICQIGGFSKYCDQNGDRVSKEDENCFICIMWITSCFRKLGKNMVLCLLLCNFCLVPILLGRLHFYCPKCGYNNESKCGNNNRYKAITNKCEIINTYSFTRKYVFPIISRNWKNKKDSNLAYK